MFIASRPDVRENAEMSFPQTLEEFFASFASNAPQGGSWLI
jgi:hypothetical protein